MKGIQIRGLQWQTALAATIVIALAAVLLSYHHLESRRNYRSSKSVNPSEESQRADSDLRSGKEVERLTTGREDLDSRTVKDSSSSQVGDLGIRSDAEVPVYKVVDKASRPDGARNQISPLELLDQTTAVGRPFPLSESIIRTCRSSVPAKSECPRLMEFLSEFTREPRDVVWAREMEERLEKAIAFPDPGKFLIRSIECRSFRCVLEVSAPYEWYLGELDQDHELSRQLHGPTVGDLGFEKGPDGEKVIVTVAGFVRQ